MYEQLSHGNWQSQSQSNINQIRFGIRREPAEYEYVGDGELVQIPHDTAFLEVKVSEVLSLALVEHGWQIINHDGGSLTCNIEKSYNKRTELCDYLKYLCQHEPDIGSQIILDFSANLKIDKFSFKDMLERDTSMLYSRGSNSLFWLSAKECAQQNIHTNIEFIDEVIEEASLFNEKKSCPCTIL